LKLEAISLCSPGNIISEVNGKIQDIIHEIESKYSEYEFTKDVLDQINRALQNLIINVEHETLEKTVSEALLEVQHSNFEVTNSLPPLSLPLSPIQPSFLSWSFCILISLCLTKHKTNNSRIFSGPKPVTGTCGSNDSV